MKKLSELKIGDMFQITEKGLVWVKKTVQGLNDGYSYCRSLKKIKTRCLRFSYRNRLFSQKINVLPFEGELLINTLLDGTEENILEKV